jgi:hypothetical protein
MLVSEIVASYSIRTKEEVREKLEAHLKTQINDMVIGDHLIIPCGYMNGNIYDLFGKNVAEGHSITMKLIKTDVNTFSLRCFNTSSDMHKRDPNKHNHYYPYIVDGISSETLLNTDFLNKLTHNAYRTRNENHEIPLYAFLSDAGTENLDFTNERSYHTQGNVNNCTKKSLQVWMHDELAKNQSLYNQFRSFKLEKTLEETRPQLSKFWGMFYTVPLAAIGGQTSNPVGSIFFRLMGFLFGSRLRVPVPKSTISQLHWYGEQLAKIRATKVAGKPLNKQKIPAHILKDTPSIEMAVKDLVSKTPGLLTTQNKNRTIMYGVACANKVYHQTTTFAEESISPTSGVGSNVLRYNDLKAALKLIENPMQRKAFLDGYLTKMLTLGKWTTAAEIGYDYFFNEENPDRFDSTQGSIVRSWHSHEELHRDIHAYTKINLANESIDKIVNTIQNRIDMLSHSGKVFVA